MDARKAERIKKRRRAGALFHIHSAEFAKTVGKAGGISSDRRIFITCQKVRYPFKSTAESARFQMEQKTGDTFATYRCRRCRAWHIGHAR